MYAVERSSRCSRTSSNAQIPILLCEAVGDCRQNKFKKRVREERCCRQNKFKKRVREGRCFCIIAAFRAPGQGRRRPRRRVGTLSASTPCVSWSSPPIRLQHHTQNHTHKHEREREREGEREREVSILTCQCVQQLIITLCCLGLHLLLFLIVVLVGLLRLCALLATLHDLSYNLRYNLPYGRG